MLYAIFVDPFVQMVQMPDLFVQTLWDGLVSGVLYALIALGFVLIFKASGVFNFAQGIMVVFSALTLVGVYEKLGAMGLSGPSAAFLALLIALGVMFLLAVAVERVVLRPLVNQPDIILFMATFGITYFLIGFGEAMFGGDPKQMIADQLLLPQGAYDVKMLGGHVLFQKIDIAATVIASLMIAGLGLFFQFNDTESAKILERVGIPVINLISLYGRSEAEWRSSTTGLSSFEGTFNLAAPELAGTIAPTVVGTKEKVPDPVSGLNSVITSPIPSRVAMAGPVTSVVNTTASPAAVLASRSRAARPSGRLRACSGLAATG